MFFPSLKWGRVGLREEAKDQTKSQQARVGEKNTSSQNMPCHANLAWRNSFKEEATGTVSTTHPAHLLEFDR